uniref:Peptidase S1 domain-containing protein n=1 Tax=Acrobeloides nanus TaxID=290746 RepID=A0A914D740_9BILA
MPKVSSIICLILFCACFSSFCHAQAQTCGTRSGNFTQKYGNGIIDGCYAQQGEFPWEGLFELYNASSGALIRFCGVTLLSQQYALTSGVCIETALTPNVTHIIRFGMLNRTDYSVQNNSISQSWINPAYNRSYILHNIGLIKLTLNETYNTNVQPICIAKNDSALISHANMVAGWGYWSLNSQYCGNQTTGYSNTNSQILIKTTVPVINNVLCQLYYPDINTTLTSDTLCAGSDFNGASPVNDWATPLMTANKNGVWFQTGIYSAYFSSSLNDQFAQRLYTRVSSYCSWLSSLTNGTVQCYDAEPPITPPPTLPPPNYLCGERGSSWSNKILGGCYAQQGEFPWEGILELSNSTSGRLLQYCGITLLSKNYALTSGKCIEIAQYAGVSNIIRFGSVNRSDSTASNNGIFRGILNPSYNPSNVLHNIGIIQLASTVSFTDRLQPICVPKDDTALISKANTIAGWGYWSLDSLYCGNQTTNTIRNSSEILVKTTVPVINNVNCQLYYPSFNETLTKDTLCAGTDFNGASTSNDWATPLMTVSSNGVWFQTGIFSMYIYIPMVQEILAQRIYARVSSYCDWFANVTNGEVQCVGVDAATTAVSTTTTTTAATTMTSTAAPATTPTAASAFTSNTSVVTPNTTVSATNPPASGNMP